MVDSGTPVLGIAGWKNSGKTTMMVRLIAQFTSRGVRVATIKHAHHDFDVDPGETDSARHRRAGARQVAVVSDVRRVVITEFNSARAPNLLDILGQLDPADLVLIEGFKHAAIRKIEVRRAASADRVPLADTDPLVIAIAADHPIADPKKPTFSLDDVAGIADFIDRTLGPLRRSQTSELK